MNTSHPQPSSEPPAEPHRPASRRWLKPLARKLARTLAWTLASLATLLILAVAMLSLLLNNARVHAYILTTVQKQATQALGVRVQLQNFTLHLATLSLDLYGITVDGAQPYANPPLLQVNHASAAVRIVSILHARWYLDSIRIDRPIARVFVDAHGVSNIPTFKSTGNSNSTTGIFDLAIRHAILADGEFYWNDRQTILAADLHDVDFQASFQPQLQQYTGHLAYSDGHLISGSFQPIPHRLDAQFDATPTTFHLTQATLSSGPSHLDLTATLTNYANPTAEAHYDLSVEGAQLQHILGNPSIPAGLLRATGSVNYAQLPNRSLLDSLSLRGDLNSRKLIANTSGIRAQIDNLAAHYTLLHGDATLQDLHATAFGGEATASGVIAQIAAHPQAHFKASLRNISLAQLKRLAGKSDATQHIALTGVLNAQADAAWTNSIDNILAHADVDVHGTAGDTAHPASQQNAAITPIAPSNIPIQSAIHATYTGAAQTIALDKSYLRTAQTNLTLNGVVGNRSSLAVHLQADDLHEFETIADIFRTAPPGQPLQPLGLSGTASFEGAVQGTVAAPHLAGQLLLSNFKAHGSAWKLLRTSVDLSPSLASLQHATLQPASRGSITFNASAALTKWSFTPASSVQVDLNASQLDIAELVKLAGQSAPVTGTLNASLKLHGTQSNPAGGGTVSLTNLTAYDQPVQMLKTTFSGEGGEVHADLTAQLSAGSFAGQVSLRPADKTYTAQLSTVGLRLDKLEALKAQHIDAVGALDLHASGQGSFDDPQLYATLQIPQLVLQKQTVANLNLRVNLAHHLANAELSTAAVGTTIQAKAQVHLTGDYLADATLDTQGIPLGPLLAVYAPAQASSISGQTELHATLHGPLKDKNHLEAHLTIPVLKLAYSNTIQLAAVDPIRVDYKNGVVELQHGAIRGPDTDLQFQGSIPVSGNAPASLLLKGAVDLKLAQLFDPDIRSAGQVKFNINSLGSTASPDFGGQIEIVNASYSSDDLPVGLERANGLIALSKDRLSITKFQGAVGGGSVTAQGGVSYQKGIRFDLGLAAQGVRLLYPAGLRESVDANIRLTGSTDNAQLGGSVNLSDLSFTPAFDLSSFITQFSGGVAAPPSQGFANNLQLNLAVRSSNDIALVSRTLSVDGSANLQVRGTAANPVILGRINLNNGDIILNGDRFVLNGGTIEFVNPAETEPVVNVGLNTTIQQYNLSLRFSGPASQLHTEYSSDPALPAADIINLLAFGQTTENTTPLDPNSLVASQVTSQVTSRISKIAGISQLSINPVLAGSSSQGPAGANVTIQQRVTGNLFVTFSSNVASTQSQTIQGQYQLSPRVAVSATRDPNGGFAFDALIKKSW